MVVSIMGVFKLLLVIFQILNYSFAGRVLLLFPMSSPSAKEFVTPLASSLLQRGHQVTWVGGKGGKFSIGEHENLTKIFPVRETSIADYAGRDLTVVDYRRRYKNLVMYLEWNVDFAFQGCEKVYQNELFRSHVLQAEKNFFDVMIVDSYMHQCLLALSPFLKTPFIVWTPLPFSGIEYMSNGLRIHAPTTPNAHLPFINNMQLWERTANFLFFCFFRLGYYPVLGRRAEAIYRRHLGETSPSLSEIEPKVSLIFSNSHPAVSYGRPLPQEVVELACLHCRKGRPLPKYLKERMGTDPVVYFSFGTMFNIRQFPEQLLQMIVRVLGRLKGYKVIFVSELPIANTTNFYVTSWVPQQDLLANRQVRLFITHGGWLSYMESVYHGVPLVVLPIYADMAFAATHSQNAGTGEIVDIDGVSEEEFERTVNQVLSTPEYGIQAKRLSKLLKDQPQDPLAKATFWTEYVMRHKGNDNEGLRLLQSSERTLNAFQYYAFDIVLVLLFGFFLLLRVIKWLCNFGIKVCIPNLMS